MPKEATKDPALLLAQQLVENYLANIRPAYSTFSEKEEALMQPMWKEY